MPVKKPNTWKVVAIIFIVLFFLETFLIIWVISVGSKSMDNEKECSVNICGEINESTSYSFDSIENTCYCYDNNGEVIKTQFIK